MRSIKFQSSNKSLNTVKARITGHSENGAPLKTGRVVQELVPPHTNDSLKTGRHSQTGRLTNRHFLHIIYCFVPLSVFLRYQEQTRITDYYVCPETV